MNMEELNGPPDRLLAQANVEREHWKRWCLEREAAFDALVTVADQVAVAFNTHLAAILNQDVTKLQDDWGKHVEVLGTYRDVRNRLDPEA